MPRSKRLAVGTIGTTPAGVEKPTLRSSRKRITPVAASTPNAEPPVSRMACARLTRLPGGKGGNQAVAAARLGASVCMIGRVGRDSFGRELSRSLRSQGVITRWVLSSERPTGAALIMVDKRGENSIAVAPGASNDLEPEAVPRRAIEA